MPGVKASGVAGAIAILQYFETVSFRPIDTRITPQYTGCQDMIRDEHNEPTDAEREWTVENFLSNVDPRTRCVARRSDKKER